MGARVVEAAGALCWRRTGGGLELLRVHSARWDEWSWPKGHRRRPEPFPVTAVREVREETGARIALGLPLPSVEYELPDGRRKRVSLWSAQVLDQGPATAGPDEITRSRWLSVDQLHEQLTRDSELLALDRLLELDQAGLLDPAQLIVVRHAKAVGRARWDGDDATRPLHARGLRQTSRLSGLLACWAPDRVISSPWTRCAQSVAPYASDHGLRVEYEDVFSELGHAQRPGAVRDRVVSLLQTPGRIALCTHRPVLESIVSTLAGTVGPDGEDVDQRGLRAQLPDRDPWLAPAQLLVTHHRNGHPVWAEVH